MKTSVILRMIGALSGAVANIPVHYKVTLSCDITSANYTGCLRGMHCTDERTCEKPLLNSLPYHQLFKKKSRPRSIGQLVKRALSEDGKCGPDNGDLLCDPKSTVYTGTCCSQYGWCGNTPAHCGNGCVSGCSNTVEGASSPTSSQEPVLGAPSTAPANGKDTSDGTCGAGNGNTVCGNWPQGACCSLYGVKSVYALNRISLTNIISSVEILLLTAAMVVRADHVTVRLPHQSLVRLLLLQHQTRVHSR